MRLRAFGVLLLGVWWARKRSSTYIGVFQEVSDGLGEAADAHDALSSSVPKASQAQKHVFTAFSEGFSKAKRMLECLLGSQTNPNDAPDAGARARGARGGGGGGRSKHRLTPHLTFHTPPYALTPIL